MLVWKIAFVKFPFFVTSALATYDILFPRGSCGALRNSYNSTTLIDPARHRTKCLVFNGTIEEALSGKKVPEEQVCDPIPTTTTTPDPPTTTLGYNCTLSLDNCTMRNINTTTTTEGTTTPLPTTPAPIEPYCIIENSAGRITQGCIEVGDAMEKYGRPNNNPFFTDEHVFGELLAECAMQEYFDINYFGNYQSKETTIGKFWHGTENGEAKYLFVCDGDLCNSQVVNKRRTADYYADITKTVENLRLFDSKFDNTIPDVLTFPYVKYPTVHNKFLEYEWTQESEPPATERFLGTSALETECRQKCVTKSECTHIIWKVYPYSAYYGICLLFDETDGSRPDTTTSPYYRLIRPELSGLPYEAVNMTMTRCILSQPDGVYQTKDEYCRNTTGFVVNPDTTAEEYRKALPKFEKCDASDLPYRKSPTYKTSNYWEQEGLNAIYGRYNNHPKDCQGQYCGIALKQGFVHQFCLESCKTVDGEPIPRTVVAFDKETGEDKILGYGYCCKGNYCNNNLEVIKRHPDYIASEAVKRSDARLRPKCFFFQEIIEDEAYTSYDSETDQITDRYFVRGDSCMVERKIFHYRKENQSELSWVYSANEGLCDKYPDMNLKNGSQRYCCETEYCNSRKNLEKMSKGQASVLKMATFTLLLLFA